MIYGVLWIWLNPQIKRSSLAWLHIAFLPKPFQSEHCSLSVSQWKPLPLFMMVQNQPEFFHRIHTQRNSPASTPFQLARMLLVLCYNAAVAQTGRVPVVVFRCRPAWWVTGGNEASGKGKLTMCGGIRPQLCIRNSATRIDWSSFGPRQQRIAWDGVLGSLVGM